jgi:sulfur relay (sulfurtransferase) complex TusBCD TusD component (DsrE family)
MILCPNCKAKVNIAKLNRLNEGVGSAVELCKKCNRLRGMCKCDMPQSRIPNSIKPPHTISDSRDVKNQIVTQ